MSATEICSPAGILQFCFSEPPRDGILRPCIFLDRDGVINDQIAGSYVSRWSEFHFVLGIVEALAELSRLGLPIIVVSNQAGVEKGIIDVSDLADITRRFVEHLRGAGVRIDGVYYCPHLAERACACRKPREGLLRAAACEFRLDLSRSVLIGDSMSDVEAARAAGCNPILLDRTSSRNPGPVADAVTFQEMPEIVSYLRRVYMAEAVSFLQSYKSDLLKAIETIDLANVKRAIEILGETREAGGHIFVCGNGGSASTASHFACDMVKGASFNRSARFRIMALTDSLPTITAYSNDVSYECVFVEQLKNFAREGDVVIAISGSGNSPNVLRAVEYGNSIGCQTIALTGRNGGKLGPLAQLNIQTSNSHMGRIEDSHLLVLHMISYYFMESANGSETFHS